MFFLHEMDKLMSVLMSIEWWNKERRPLIQRLNNLPIYFLIYKHKSHNITKFDHTNQTAAWYVTKYLVKQISLFVSKLTLILVKPQPSQYNTTLFWIYIYIWLLFKILPSKLRYYYFYFLGFLLAPRPVYDENYTKWISPSHFYIAKMFVKHIFKASNKGCFYWIFYSYIIILV